MLKSFAVGFLGALAALMVAAAIWFAVIQPLNNPGLVWGGSVYHSKQEFKLYLRSKGLSYATWLTRNPGVAPWEPGSRVVKSDQRNQVWDWKRDSLLAVIAALLASIAAVLLARHKPHGELRAGMEPAARGDRGAHARAAARAAVGYLGLGARAVAQEARESFRSSPSSGGQHEALVLVFAAGLATLVGLLVAFLLAG